MMIYGRTGSLVRTVLVTQHECLKNKLVDLKFKCFTINHENWEHLTIEVPLSLCFVTPNSTY